ncbi:MAG: hypothetical protein R2911_15055 [Caldilineaceae bacterium]
MREITFDPKPAAAPNRRWLTYFLQAMILLPAVAGIFAYRVWIAQPSADGQAQPANTVISAETLEERFGVRIRLIAVTAGGGMIDFRYKVIDPDKAEFLVGETTNPPALIVEESGETLYTSNGMKHNTRLDKDSIHFLFFANADNAVKSGSTVSVVFGSVQLEPMTVQ